LICQGVFEKFFKNFFKVNSHYLAPLTLLLYHISWHLSRGFQKFLQKFLKGFATYQQPIAVGCDFGYPCGVATLGNRPCPFDTYIIPQLWEKVKMAFCTNFCEKNN
jgi:hypothetical protein